MDYGIVQIWSRYTSGYAYYRAISARLHYVNAVGNALLCSHVSQCHTGKRVTHATILIIVNCQCNILACFYLQEKNKSITSYVVNYILDICHLIRNVNLATELFTSLGRVNKAKTYGFTQNDEDIILLIN